MSASPRRSDQAPITLVGFPFDHNSSFRRGSAQAPARIREALFSPGGNLSTEDGIDLEPGRSFSDAGDLAASPEDDSFARIEERVAQLLDGGTRPLALGGDHSITLPILRAFARKHPALTIVHVDAHPDLYDDFEGNPFSHASPFARILEERLARRLVQVGLRAVTRHQRAQAERFGVEMREMRDWRGVGALSLDPGESVYLSFDVDGIDPAFAPGVSHPEPGGLSTRQAIDLIQGLPGALVGCDLVELNPTVDPGGATAVVCAKLVKEMAGRMLARRDPEDRGGKTEA